MSSFWTLDDFQIALRNVSIDVTVNIHCSQNTLEEPVVPEALLGGSSLPCTSAGDLSSSGASAQAFTCKRSDGVYIYNIDHIH